MGQTARAALLSLLSTSALVSAQSNCVSLEGSKTCPAFESASISTTGFVAGILPDELYARFTTTVICNAIVQNSISACNLTASNSRPVCADTCAEYAQGEALLTSDSSLCGTPGSNYMSQIRADFTNCALPADSLSSSTCIQGIANERDNCGYGNSTVGLCSYCSSGGINSTDTCCYNSNIDERCAGVTLPSIYPTMTFTPPTATATPTSSSTAAAAAGLSGGAIAGIVIGSVAGALLLAGLIYACILLARRRRRGSQGGSIFNQPSPSRQGPSTVKIAPAQTTSGYEVLPGGRIARMSALESASDPALVPPSRSSGPTAAAAVGGAAGYMAGRRRGDDPSSSEFGDSPESETRAGVLRPPPTNIRRTGSLSSSSVLADPQSPTSAGMSSPQAMASQQSEQLPFFKDYYSQGDIHPGDRVATLWAYQPRAPDEFALERGDMLKVVGIWDDGWATGILLDEHADEWEARRHAQRDSGVSNTSGRQDPSPPVSGEIKAFPLVCVCLPQHWRKTIEGDVSTEGSTAHQGHPSFS
ncbi:uncharacterized protein ColSpa_07462 [Colletotrichum spaethianum]|uniref:SH3 domain-containing protein n=1 Tax=Colletotrichum spaethianum TaxID=700344 RepID=A0AA37LFC0_9PEZI|nr:uncharacterized protein ColSpa_07462 [Colletotrichum spaethianum]GKT47281.1 hypothetical protein ColSpa_07462 [Colletotrichum spaethianum]